MAAIFAAAGKPVLDAAGNLYGTTVFGGTSNKGTIFKLDSSGVLTVLYSFSGFDGSEPGELVMDAVGNLYGNTFNGGDHNFGVVFKMDPSGNVTVLHSFAGAGDGKWPTGTLLLSPEGTIFGAALVGGLHGAGTLFRLKP